MRRLALIAVGILAAPFYLAAFVLLMGNIGPGHRAIESLATWGSGGEVRIAGLHGRFPDRLRASRLEVRDRAGAYVVVEDMAIDWSPTRLVRGWLAIDRLTTAHVSVLRSPEGEPAGSSASSQLPLSIAVNDLRVRRLTLAAPIAGTETDVTLDGSASFTTMTDGQLRLRAAVPADGAAYILDGAIGAAGIRLDASISEPPGGLLSRLTGLPDIGAIALKASLAGPRAALTVDARLTAGPMRGHVAGQLDLDRQQADLTVEANAPAMRPGPDIAWQSIDLNAHVQGSLSTPNATGKLRIVGLTAGTLGVEALSADLSGDSGAATLRATLTGTRASFAGGDVLAAAPLQVEANARLDVPNRPIQFALRHPLLTIEGTGATAGQLRVHLALASPDIAPLASAFGLAAHGKLAMTADAAEVRNAVQMSTDGTLDTGADVATFRAAGNLLGSALSLSDVRIGTRFGTLTGAGTLAPNAIGLRATAEIPDLATLRPDLAGKLTIAATIDGPSNDLTVGADLTGSVASAGLGSGPVESHIALRGLPDAPQGTITARGALLGAPVNLAVTARRQGNAIAAAIEQADWNSAHAEGTVRIGTDGGDRAGSIRLTIGRLADFAPLLGRTLSGAASATLDLNGTQATLGLSIRDAAVAGAGALARAELAATVRDIDAKPQLDATLTVDGVRANGTAASGSLHASGPTDALALKLTTTLPNLAGAPLTLAASGTLDAVGRKLDVGTAEASWHRKALRLLAPVRVDFANGVTLDRLRLGLDKAVLAVSGPVTPRMDLSATIEGLPASLAATFVPDLALDGMIAANARLSGNPARPDGTVKLDVTGLRLPQALGRLLPPARIAARATLAGGGARIDVRADAGKSYATVVGQIPMSAGGALDLRVAGLVDVGLIDPLLAADGWHVAGTLNLNAGIGGSMAAPSLSGGAKLANGAVRDDRMGARLTAISARLEFADGVLRVADMVAQAGPGSVRISGTAGVLAPGLPLDLTLTARNARPLASDALTLSLDADLTLRGPVAALALGGSIRTRQVDFRVPDKLPSSVATIVVRDPDRPPPPPVAPPPAIAINLDLNAPNRVFVRGRGMDVELGGTAQLRGTLEQPRASGGLVLRRGTIAFAGQTLTFVRGAIDFDGASLVDPALNLVSTTSANGVAATLTVGGTPSAPKITLSSVPELPQDEILAQLLFKRSVSTLSPLELAQIAAALASLTGLSPEIDNPLDRVRQALELDRLSVGTTKSGGAALEAGRFVAPGVYVGTKQGADGAGQATVRIDLGKGLTLRGATSTGGTATGTGGESNGSSVGVGYEFEY